MGRLIDIAFFVEATDCGMGVDFIHGDQDLVVKSVCCDEEVDLIKGQDSYKSSFSDRNASVPLYFSANTTFEFTSPFVLGFKPCLQSVYPPPILVKDIQLFDQVFLI